MIANQPTSLVKHEIYVNEIEFRSKQEASLFGFIHHGGKFHETQYIISRKHLQTLLSENKRAGVEILWHIENLFVGPHESPASLNLIDLFGTTQLLEAGEIKLGIPCYETAQGEPAQGLHYDLCFIDDVTPQGQAFTFPIFNKLIK
jgi:hypothetical protein